MIIITGAAGFIGSCLAAYLNRVGHQDLVLVDDFSRPDKLKNIARVIARERVTRDFFIAEWFPKHATDVEFVFHLGARTDTTETNVELFNKLNLNYSKSLWRICANHDIPLVYASSAATYGGGEFGYDDKHALIPQLKPLNPYGDSKQNFDKWVLELITNHQSLITDRVGERGLKNPTPPFWAGLKFFNVYGANEYHKGRMASVVFHCFNQVKATGAMKLFRSHRPDIMDGHQARDFIYVMDIIKVCAFFMEHQQHSGIYNLGTGKARTFLDLTIQTFLSMGLSPDISFIDTPEDIRDTYQYFTEAKMDKLRTVGYVTPFYSLEDGVREYVREYLTPQRYFGT